MCNFLLSAIKVIQTMEQWWWWRWIGISAKRSTKNQPLHRLATHSLTCSQYTYIRLRHSTQRWFDGRFWMCAIKCAQIAIKYGQNYNGTKKNEHVKVLILSLHWWTTFFFLTALYIFRNVFARTQTHFACKRTWKNTVYLRQITSFHSFLWKKENVMKWNWENLKICKRRTS